MASGLGKLAGVGAAGEQLLIWQVLGAIISAVLGPELELLTREVNKVLPATPLTPDQLADMVVKGHVDQASAESYARESGIAPADFQRMVDDAGEPPGLVFLLEAFRRGYISQAGSGPESTSLEQGIRESRLHPKWTSVVEQMGLQPIGVADAVDAVVEAQIPYALGEHIAYLNGVGPDDFKILTDTRGNPPAPSELAELLKRGLIPLEGTGPDIVSFQQGIFEGASKDKWWTLYAKLADYIPPARTVITLIRDGAITDEQGLAYFAQNGLTEELAQIYLKNAHFTKGAVHRATISTELRTVARRGYMDGHFNEAQFRQIMGQANVPADVIDQEVQAANLSMQIGRHVFNVAEIKKQRQDGLIGDAQALQRLVVAGWSEEDAQTQINQWNAESTAGRTGLSEARILSYLVAGILTQAQAYDLLLQQGINTANATFLVQHPETVPAVKAHGSSSADIIAAYKDGVLDLATTRQKLIDSGETPEAADLKLQVAHYVLNRGPKPKNQVKNLTEAQIMEAFKAGLVADTWVLRELATLGYTDQSASILVAIEETKLAGTIPASWTQLT